MSGDSLDEIFRPEMKQAYEPNKKNWLATDQLSERTPGLFKPEFVVQEACGLVQSSTLFKMRHSIKINIAAEVFQSRIMICLFSAIKMSRMFF